ncbi:MAG: hypothetical protein KGI75_11115, partial [Rhizobiaceae bacterium]|nr:hypothetical protein [Rhizobiaceae bacterium]
ALGILQREARRFGVSERADEVLRPTMDHRQKKHLVEAGRLVPQQAGNTTKGREDIAGTASVMPRGRNFH